MKPETQSRIGVYVCHCGGNISDYVDVGQVAAAVAQEPGVAVSRTHMFTCSDAAQQEIIKDIQEQKLNGLVIASCSPKLHMYTFRAMAERAGVNPYQYVQVNLREQDSWAHTHHRDEATRKGIALVKAGIAKSRLSEPLFPLRVNTKPRVLVVGGGVTGLKTALALSDLGIAVDVVERGERLGGWVAEWKKLYPTGQDGRALVAELEQALARRANIRVHTRARVTGKSGNLGDFTIRIRTPQGEQDLNVGALVMATGFAAYAPLPQEFGFGLPGVVTLPELKKSLSRGEPLQTPDGRPVKTLAFIYCVGSRQKKTSARPQVNTHCSRTCCTAAAHLGLNLTGAYPGLRQYHLYRDVRTYGKHELIFGENREKGAVYVRFDEKEPPVVSTEGAQLRVRVKDTLTRREELEIAADLVVLVTGMLPRENAELINILKVPVDRNGFFKEIHPKLRPVETVMDGLFIAGAAQSPRLIGEAVSSALAAVSKCGALLKKGYVDLEPMIAVVKTDKCTGCNACLGVCPYQAIEKTVCDGRDQVTVIPFSCKGCGACVPLCPEDALDVKGYTDEQMTAAITALAQEAAV